MKAVCGLDNAPVFCPVVAPFYSGMQVTVPLFNTNVNAIKQIYSEIYKGKIIEYKDVSDNGFLSANALSGTDKMAVSVYGNDERAVLCATFDNLGKGASGAAIQNMNIILNLKETEGLII
jgi:N-acetyl-gamma-glutamyl-phosphate reductase